MKDVTSWDDVINYVLQMDKESFSRDPMGVKAELDRMLVD